MPTCPHCDLEYDSEAKFCTTCGRALDRSDSDIPLGCLPPPTRQNVVDVLLGTRSMSLPLKHQIERGFQGVLWDLFLIGRTDALDLTKFSTVDEGAVERLANDLELTDADLDQFTAFAGLGYLVNEIEELDPEDRERLIGVWEITARALDRIGPEDLNDG